MHFIQEEAEAKIWKRVRVRDDSFSDVGVTKGTRGTVEGFLTPGGVSKFGPTEALSLPEGQYGVSVRFDKPPGTLVEFIGRELYDKSLEELL